MEDVTENLKILFGGTGRPAAEGGGLNKRNLNPRRKAKDYDNDDGAEDDDDKTPSAGRPKKVKGKGRRRKRTQFHYTKGRKEGAPRSRKNEDDLVNPDTPALVDCWNV